MMTNVRKRMVFVVGGLFDYMKMFENNGWGCVDCIEDADLVQFCGGEDVNPQLYGEEYHPNTWSNPDRDEYEAALFNLAVEDGCAISGICRGAQFVHVMNGGKLFQHVDNHAVGSEHLAWAEDNRWAKGHKDVADLAAKGFAVTSTHHQMMRDGDEGGGCVTLLVARESGRQQTANMYYSRKSHRDIEAVYHEYTNSLCYQPHPEYVAKDHPCQTMYFKMIDILLNP